MEHESEDERWIWLSFVSEHRLILGAYAGPMTQDSADRIIQITGEKINEKKLPIFINTQSSQKPVNAADRENLVKCP